MSAKANELEMEIYHLQVQFCKAMAHPKRLQIINSLKVGEKTVNVLTRELGMSQANMSQHLAILRASEIVTTRRDGLRVYYRIADHRIVKACELVRDATVQRLYRSKRMIDTAESIGSVSA